MNYSSSMVNLQMFNQAQERHRKQLLKALDRMLEPLLEEGRKALEEFLEEERYLEYNKFSRS